MANRPIMTIVQGATSPIEVYFIGENDLPDSLAGADQATIYMRDSPSDQAAFIFRWRTAPPAGSSNLTIDVANAKLVGTMSGSESGALPIGLWVAEAAVRFGSTDAWKVSHTFDVLVIQPTAAKT